MNTAVIVSGAVFSFVATLVILLAAAFVLSVLNLIFALRSIIYRKSYPSYAVKYDSSKVLTVAVFVPCKGIEEKVDVYLKAMLTQDYPSYRIYFITESESDAATPLIRSLIEKYPYAYGVISGRAVQNCQKNHNLLAAINEELKREDKAEVFVFADADVKPGKTWLRDLILPLSDLNVHATTAFRWLKPEKFTFWGTMHAMLSAYLGTLMSSSDGMWGGSMAIKRDVFLKYGVDKRWAKAVADDISLMEIIIKNKLKRIFVPICLAESSNVINDPKALFEWFLRQVQYLKIYCKPHWIAAIVFTGLNTLTALGLFVCFFPFIVSFCIWQTYAMLFYCLILIFFLMILSLSRFEGKEGQNYFVWFLMALPALLMGFSCLIASIFRKDMIWRGIRYGINKDGTVSFVKVELENG